MRSVTLREEKCIITWQVSGSVEKDVQSVRFQTADEPSLVCGGRNPSHSGTFWFARVLYVELRRHFLLLCVRSSDGENIGIFLCQNK